MNTKKAKKMDRMKRVAEGMKKNMPKKARVMDKKLMGKPTPKKLKGVKKVMSGMFQDHMPNKKKRLKIIDRMKIMGR